MHSVMLRTTSGCVGLVIGAAVMDTVVSLVFRRVGIDPSVASGPLITTPNDGLSLHLYFEIAAYYLLCSV